MTAGRVSGGRGMALVQALLIVAALAGVAAALLLRTGEALGRLDARLTTDRLATHLDSATLQLRAMLTALPPGEPVHTGQAWARVRDDIVIDGATLSWAVQDLHGRFNVNWLSGSAGAMTRDAFLRLADGVQLPREVARRMADLLSPDDAARAAAAAPGQAPPLPLVHPDQLAPLAATEPEAFARLRPLLAALAPESALNVNTVLPEVLAALLAGAPRSDRERILRQQRLDPARSTEAFLDWAETALTPATLDALAALSPGVDSTAFGFEIGVRLDSGALRRSGVIGLDGTPRRAAVLLSLPEFD